MTRIAFSVAAGAALFICVSALDADGGGAFSQSGMFPFLVPSIGSWDNPTDLSRLNETPAGRDGFIRVEGGHFVDGAGQRIRFLGGALAHGANFPSHDAAERLAARLAMCGFNLVRLHHMDGAWAPRGIWDPKYKDRQHIDQGQLERLDYLVSRLKAHGVYANINLHVSRKFTEAGGFPQANELPKYDKGVDNFVPRMIELQQQYARQLLTHENPYTGTRYVDEPAIAFVEINNENSLLYHVLRGHLGELPERYAKHLLEPWNEWLAERYDNDAALAATWQIVDMPLGQEMLENGDFSDGAEHWAVQSPDLTSAETEQTGPVNRPCLHLHFDGPGPLPWSMQFHQIGLDFDGGEPYTFEFRMRSQRPAEVRVVARLDHAHPETGRFEVIGLNTSLRATPQWQRFQYTFIARNPSEGGNRIGFSFPNESGDFWIADASLRPGGHIGPAPDESLEKRNIGRPMKHLATPGQWRDWIRFIGQLELDYATGMYEFLKEELGVKCPVIDTQVSYGGVAGLYRESQLDYADMHAYWQHPRFPGKSWDMSNWRVENSPMVAEPERSTVMRVAQCRPVNTPLILSEFNHPTPNHYAAEAWPVTASFAALQDWDGIVIHNYLNYDSEDWGERHWNHFFDTATNPQKAPFVQAAALIFRRGYVSPAPGELRLLIPTESVYDLAAKDRWRMSSLWADSGLDWRAALSHRLVAEFVPGGVEPRLVETESTPDRISGGISWDADDNAVYTVDAPAVKAAIGYIAGREIELGAARIAMADTPTGFAAITLIALDGKPIRSSSDLLLSAAGRAANAGWQWRDDHEMLAKMGSDPALAEGIPARINLATEAAAVRVSALDGAGNAASEVPAQIADGNLRIEIGPEYRTLWYHISCEQ